MLRSLYNRLFSVQEENENDSSSVSVNDSFESDETNISKDNMKKSKFVISENELEIIFNKMDQTDYRNGDNGQPRYLDLDRLKRHVLFEKQKNGGKKLVDIKKDPMQFLICPPRNIYHLIFEGDLNLKKYEGTLDEDEIDIIFFGIEKSDYTSFGRTRYRDFSKVANNAVKQKNTNGNRKIKSIKLDMVLESLPPINEYSIVFE